jgi:hypothetical protein
VIAFVGGTLLLGLNAADVGGLAAYAAPVSVFLFDRASLTRSARR